MASKILSSGVRFDSLLTPITRATYRLIHEDLRFQNGAQPAARPHFSRRKGHRNFLRTGGPSNRSEPRGLVHREKPDRQPPRPRIRRRHLSRRIGGLCRYFEISFPEPPMMGVGPRDCAFVEMWNRRMELEVFHPLARSMQHTHPFIKDRFKQFPEFGGI